MGAVVNLLVFIVFAGVCTVISELSKYKKARERARIQAIEAETRNAQVRLALLEAEEQQADRIIERT